jgi:hypothetical protein
MAVFDKSASLLARLEGQGSGRVVVVVVIDAWGEGGG